MCRSGGAMICHGADVADRRRPREFRAFARGQCSRRRVSTSSARPPTALGRSSRPGLGACDRAPRRCPSGPRRLRRVREPRPRRAPAGRGSDVEPRCLVVAPPAGERARPEASSPRVSCPEPRSPPPWANGMRLRSWALFPCVLVLAAVVELVASKMGRIRRSRSPTAWSARCCSVPRSSRRTAGATASSVR